MKDFIPFALPQIGEAEINEVIDSLRSGWVTTGPKTKMFEQNFVDFLGDSSLEAISVNSATAGLHLALEAIGICEGDEVIVPSYTFTATAEIVRYLGATPVIVDVDSKTFNITASNIERAISPRTKAIIPVHFSGLSCEMNEIIALAKKFKLKVVEDAAHALPTTYKGKLVGTLDTDATVFSFYANKTMTTGEGGMLVTRNKKIAKRAKIMRLHGISRDAFDRYTSDKPAWTYEVIAPGYKYNMTDIAASIGIHQLKRIEDFQKRRHDIAMYYTKSLGNLDLELPVLPPANELHAWHLFPIKLSKNITMTRDEFIERMFDAGVGCSVHFIPLHLHPYWKNSYNLTKEMYPNSQDIFEREVSLPLYTKMTDDEVTYVVETVKRVLLNE